MLKLWTNQKHLFSPSWNISTSNGRDSINKVLSKELPHNDTSNGVHWAKPRIYQHHSFCRTNTCSILYAQYICTKQLQVYLHTHIEHLTQLPRRNKVCFVFSVGYVLTERVTFSIIKKLQFSLNTKHKKHGAQWSFSTKMCRCWVINHRIKWAEASGSFYYNTETTWYWVSTQWGLAVWSKQQQVWFFTFFFSVWSTRRNKECPIYLCWLPAGNVLNWL